MLAAGAASYWRPSSPGGPLEACELLAEVEQFTIDPGDVGRDDPNLIKTTYPFAMVLSQDCDLEWDAVARRQIAEAGTPPAIGQERKDWDQADRVARTKLIDGVLLCVADPEEVVRVPSLLPTKIWQFASSNQHERYHFLRVCPGESDLQGEGIPALVLDFKRFFTLPAEELAIRASLAPEAPGRVLRRAVLVSPYLEDVASRFFAYQSRVALPDEARPD